MGVAGIASMMLAVRRNGKGIASIVLAVLGGGRSIEQILPGCAIMLPDSPFDVNEDRHQKGYVPDLW
ncbi:MAG: hypothetical protein Kow0063_08760 [Anaerolineae bacterium]